jgi:hypothetical protein
MTRTGTFATQASIDLGKPYSPDPLWRVAPATLRHLEQGHMGELIHCVRAHGMPQAD